MPRRDREGGEEMKAIITAAGRGTRMGPLTRNIPKCTLPLRGETILGRQLRILRGCSVFDTIIVAGFCRKTIYNMFNRQARILSNPLYETTNNLYSLQIAEDFLTDDTLLLNADGVFTEQPIRDLIAAKHEYVLGTDNNTGMREDARKVRIVDGLVIESSHALPSKLAFGEVAGMAKIEKGGIEAFKEVMSQMDKQDPHIFWADVFNPLAQQGFEVHYILVDTPWIEIDTVEDYEEAKKLVL